MEPIFVNKVVCFSKRVWTLFWHLWKQLAASERTLHFAYSQEL